MGGGPDETFGYTVEDLLEHLLNGGQGLSPRTGKWDITLKERVMSPF
jgi:hypothetical protein